MKGKSDKSYTRENYLKALFHLGTEKGEVTINELAKHLGLKMPSVTSMIKRLSEEKLLKYEKYKPFKLTEKGRKEAAGIIRKHRLTEMFLVEIMKFGWEEVHDIAEQMEHLKSDTFFKKIDEMLGHPTIDPHGSPIPDKKGNIEPVQGTVLSSIGAGSTVELTGLAYSGNDFLKFLNSKNIHLGIKMKIVEKEPFDNSLQIEIDGVRISLSNLVTKQLLVKER